MDRPVPPAILFVSVLTIQGFSSELCASCINNLSSILDEFEFVCTSLSGSPNNAFDPLGNPITVPLKVRHHIPADPDGVIYLRHGGGGGVGG